MEYIDKSHKLLTKDEEVKLFQIIQSSEPNSKEYLAARDKIILGNIRLICSIAKRKMHKGLEFDELVNEGIFGIVRAIEKFDLSRGYKFSTYATAWVRQAINRAIADKSDTIRIPVHIAEKLHRLKPKLWAIVAELGYMPDKDVIAKRLDISKSEVGIILNIENINLIASLDVDYFSDDGMGEDMHAYIPDDNVDIAGEIEHKHLGEALEKILSTLNAREELIIKMRYGLLNGQCYTLEEVGKRFNLTRERIRQIERAAIHKLSHPRRTRKLKDYCHDR